MKSSIYLFVFFALLQFNKSNANPALFLVVDSIGLTTQNTRSYILYKVEPRETLYSISKKYKVTVSELKSANPELLNKPLRMDQVILIPRGTKNNLDKPKIKTVIITHEVKKGESIYSIAKDYEIEEVAIKKLNKLKSNELRANQTLLLEVPLNPEKVMRVPVKTEKTELDDELDYSWAFQPITDEKTDVVQITHTIQLGETVDKIASTYQITTEQIIEWNALGSASILKAGQLIIIGYEYFEKRTGKSLGRIGAYAPEKNGGATKAGGLPEDPTKGLPLNKKITVMGVLISGNSYTSTDKHLALHRTAKVGSYIKITNPNTGKSTFVRVLGKLQDVDIDENVEIKLSKAACNAVGIVDEKFPILLEYNQ